MFVHCIMFISISCISLLANYSLGIKTSFSRGDVGWGGGGGGSFLSPLNYQTLLSPKH